MSWSKCTFCHSFSVHMDSLELALVGSTKCHFASVFWTLTSIFSTHISWQSWPRNLLQWWYCYTGIWEALLTSYNVDNIMLIWHRNKRHSLIASRDACENNRSCSYAEILIIRSSDIYFIQNVYTVILSATSFETDAPVQPTHLYIMVCHFRAVIRSRDIDLFL